MRRYASQREDQVMSLVSQYTSYVYTISAPGRVQVGVGEGEGRQGAARV